MTQPHQVTHECSLLHGSYISLYVSAVTDLMSHLMGNDVSHAPEISQAGMISVDQKGSFSVGDKAPVLHRSSSKIRDANQVQLRQGEGDTKEGFKSW